MYTSFYSKNSGSAFKARSGAKSRISASETISLSGLDANVRPVLEINQKVLFNKLAVKKILSEKSFIVFHEDYKQDFILKCIPFDENLERWIDLQTHTNIVTCFDTFVHEDKQFQLCEYTPQGNMYQYIDSLDLNLGISVPLHYIETIYDCIIQLTMALEFSHNNGLIHGQFDLSNVVIAKDLDNIICKINDFRPQTSLNMPLTSEATFWPFARQKKKISDSEKLEILMLKDIYALGICILEMMIGRVSQNKFSISLDSLPLTWAEFPESTPLIQVLVECINIDSVSQRKGKLLNIKRLLIKEYKRFFQREFYKMEQPFIGKRADVCNKKAIMALSKLDDVSAVKYWEEAFQMKEQHFDASVNYLMYKWRTAQLSDEELMSEFGKEIFQDRDKGKGLEGMLSIAMGEKEKGLDLLKSYSSEENKNVRHEHNEKIESIQINNNSKYFATSSKDSISIWSYLPNIEKLLTIPLEIKEDKDEKQQKLIKTKTLCSIDDEGKTAVVYRGQKLTFYVYSIDLDVKNYEIKDTIFLSKELERNGHYNLNFEEFDVISEIRFQQNDSKYIKIYWQRKKVPHIVELNLTTVSPSIREIERYEDKSIFKFGLTYVGHHDSLSKFIALQQSKGSLISFPENNYQQVVALNREDKQNKYFVIYDVFSERPTRKVRKEDNFFKHGQDGCDAFDIDPDGKVIIHVTGEEFSFITVKIPEIMQKYIRPRYQIAQHKESPAKVIQQKTIFINNINLNIGNFKSLLPDQTKSKETQLLLMIKKIDLAFSNKRIMQNNKPFLEMYKLLIAEQYKKFQILELDFIQKVSMFDEIKFSNDLHRIRFIELSSSPENNFMILAIDGTVYKYDLASKELHQQFKSQAFKAMKLYDNDSKIVVADTAQVKLWEFTHTEKDGDGSELISQLQVPLKVDQVFVNKKGPKFYFIVCCKNDFIVYHERLEFLFPSSILPVEVIKCLEFDKDNEYFYIGSDRGYLYKYSIAEQKQIGNSTSMGEGSIDLMYKVQGISNDDIFIMFLSKSGIKIHSTDRDKTNDVDIGMIQLQDGECSQIRGTPCGKFIFIGIANTSSLGVFKFEKGNLSLTHLKTIVVDFRFFETDELCTQIIFMNQKCRQLELFSIKWLFDISSVDKKEYDRLDDKTVDESEQNQNVSGLNADISTRSKTACCNIF